VLLVARGALGLSEMVAERAPFALEELATVLVFAPELGETVSDAGFELASNVGKPVLEAGFELVDALPLGCEQPGRPVGQKHAGCDE
jgi:hypothetical protein